MSRFFSSVLAAVLFAWGGHVALSQSVATPTANPASGTYGTMLQTTLSSATSGATLYFTLNGATPTTGAIATSGAPTWTPPACTDRVSTTSAFTSALKGAYAGEVICLTSSINLSSPIFVEGSGTANSWITVLGNCQNPSTTTITWTGGRTESAMISNYGYSFPNGNNYWTFACLSVNGGTNVGNQPGNAFQFQNSHHGRYFFNTVTNTGSGGIEAYQSDYWDVEHNIVYHNGYGSGFSSGIDEGALASCNVTGCSGVSYYAGFHNFIAWNVVSGEFDGSSNHSDGNGIMIDDANRPDTNDPGTLVISNVAYGNGGRGLACTACSNVAYINNTTYSDGLDQNQSPALYNTEIDIGGYGAHISLVNNVFSSYNGHVPINIYTAPSNMSCVDNITYGGTDSPGRYCTSGITNKNPGFVNPTAVSSPAYVGGRSGQYATTLPASTGLRNNLWVNSQVNGVNPTTLTGIFNSNQISDISRYAYTDIDGIQRPGSSIAIGAYQFQSGTIRYGGPVWIPTDLTLRAIASKSGGTSSSLSSTYTINVP